MIVIVTGPDAVTVRRGTFAYRDVTPGDPDVVFFPEIDATVSPRSWSQVADVADGLAATNASDRRKVTIVATLHEAVCLRLRRRIVEGTLSHRDVYVIDATNDRVVSFTPMGELRTDGAPWPHAPYDGRSVRLFSEGFEEVKAIRRAQHDRAEAILAAEAADCAAASQATAPPPAAPYAATPLGPVPFLPPEGWTGCRCGSPTCDHSDAAGRRRGDPYYGAPV
jgi:hypothetical protein